MRIFFKKNFLKKDGFFKKILFLIKKMEKYKYISNILLYIKYI